MDYIFYKIYSATKRGALNDIAPFASCVYLGGLIGINLMTVNMMLDKLHIVPLLLPNKYWAGAFSLLCIFLVMFFYLRKGFYKKVIARYEDESPKRRIRGNIFVGVYILVSVLILCLLPLVNCC